MYIIIKGKFWIGGTDIQNEGLWIWSSEETEITFFDWAAKQPSNSRSIEHCLIFNYLQSQQWNDSNCSLLRRFICKKSKFLVIENTSTCCRFSLERSSQRKKNNLINFVYGQSDCINIIKIQLYFSIHLNLQIYLIIIYITIPPLIFTRNKKKNQAIQTTNHTLSLPFQYTSTSFFQWNSLM